MQRSIGKDRMASQFDKYDGALTVVAFDLEGQRVSTVAGCNPLTALAEVSRLSANGNRVTMIISAEADKAVWAKHHAGERGFMNRLENYEGLAVDFGYGYGTKRA